MDKIELEKNIQENMDVKIHVILILMDTKPYRKATFSNIIEKEHIKDAELEWKECSYENKITWIKDIYISKFDEKDLNQHLLKSVNYLRHSKNYKLMFDNILETYKK